MCVFGASGDLAKKKTYPALFHLFAQDFIGDSTKFFGFARSVLNDEELRAKLRPYLEKEAAKRNSTDKVESFLNRCVYLSGAYDKPEGFQKLTEAMTQHESEHTDHQPGRLFYFALPPNVFPDVAAQIKGNCMLDTTNGGWNRVVIEKPFGHDLASSEELSTKISSLFTEDEIYRIDHYLGKEMVQNLMMLRFSNILFSNSWSREQISCVQITFKEPFGTEGRGGYFDQSGIIRDILQNHLMQVFSIVAMEPPVSDGPESIRDEKTRVLRATQTITLEDTVLGQYTAANGNAGYLDDEGVAKDSVIPTFATCVLHVDNDRWRGVPFILKAAKATNERKAEIRIQFKRPSTAPLTVSPNELVMLIQPSEAVYVKINTKTPGLNNHVLESELDLTYKDRYENLFIPEAYERLILDVVRGEHHQFVRRDELAEAWRIFTPLLHKTESERIKPIPYPFGSRGPTESDDLISKHGYIRSSTYQWKK